MNLSQTLRLIVFKKATQSSLMCGLRRFVITLSRASEKALLLHSS